MCDLVHGIQRRQPVHEAGGVPAFEPAFLKKIEEAGDETEDEGGVGHEESRDMKKEPSAADDRGSKGVFVGAERRHQHEQKGEREGEDAE